jgi:hypothetical protein
MVQLSIRCHPCMPVAADQLERWLDHQVAELRCDVPHGTIRLSRLTQHLPNTDVSVGWLLELELVAEECGHLRPRIVAAIRDMRLLGLQPTLMAPAAGDWSESNGAAGDDAAVGETRRLAGHAPVRAAAANQARLGILPIR